jgi:RNA recognition motif-containing protein
MLLYLFIMNIYVGNLDYKITEDELANHFAEFGEVTSSRIITDKFSGRSKGFGFIEMSNDEEAKKAIENLNGASINNRNAVVNEARPREERPRRDF